MSMGFMSGDLGGARFTVTADTEGFSRGMKRAESEARRATQRLNASFTRLDSQASVHFRRATREAEAFGAAMRKATSKDSARWGQGFYALSAALEDASYGFRGVINNIPQVVMMFGGSMGLAAGASVTAVAVNQLVERWGALEDAMKSAWLNVPADHLEKLRIRAEKASEAFGKLMQTPSKMDAKQIEAVTEAMVEADRGGPAMPLKGIREIVENDPNLKAEVGPGDWAEIAKRMAGKNILGMNAQQLMGLRGKVIAEMLRERNAKTAADIMGRALLPGEEGASGRATIQRMVKEHPASFTKKFREMFAETTDEAIESMEANRAAAARFIKGPLGARMLMGEGKAPGGPASKEQLEGLVKRTQPRFIIRHDDGRLGLGGRIAEQLAKAGLNEDQARAVMKGLGRRAVFDRAQKINREEIHAALGPHGTVPGEIAEEATKRMLAEGIAAAKKRGVDSPFLRDVERHMKAAGIEGGTASGTAKEMRKILDERIKARMMERGMTRAEAERSILQDEARGLRPGFNRPAEYVGLAEHAKRIQIAALNGNGHNVAARQHEYGKEQLAVQKKMVDLLEKLNQKERKQTAAVAGTP